MTPPRAILHVDMDAFFASVEQLDDPRLRGKAVLVGGDGRRGVVAAASYEARVYGCRSAQPMAVAKRNCPHAIVVHPRGRRYRELSSAVFEILDSVTPLVQPLSIDEAFLDVTGSVRLLGTPPDIAVSIRRRIAEETGLTASVGVAWNKFLAKLASEWDKPDGLTVLEPGDIETRVAALPIGKMWGVGPAMETRLRRHGIETFGDLQRLDHEDACARLGRMGDHLWHLARGEDERPVTPDGRAKSIGNERTFGEDLQSSEQVRHVLLGQCEHVGWRLRRNGLSGRTVTVKIRFGDFETISRSATLDEAIDSTDALCRTASDLFEGWATAGFRPVRLIGVTMSGLSPAGTGQLSLFPAPEQERSNRLDRATDAIVDRFGRGSIHRGVDAIEESTTR